MEVGQQLFSTLFFNFNVDVAGGFTLLSMDKFRCNYFIGGFIGNYYCTNDCVNREKIKGGKEIIDLIVENQDYKIIKIILEYFTE